MPNQRYNKTIGVAGAGGASNKAPGSAASTSMPEKDVGYPGVPGATQSKSRSGGTPTTGYAGPFYVKKVGL